MSIEDLAREKFGEPNRRLSSRKEARYGRKGSVSVCLTGDKAGQWYDFEAQRGGHLTKHDDGYQRPPQRRGGLTWDSSSEPKFRREIESSSILRPGEPIQVPRSVDLPMRIGDAAIYRLPDGRAMRYGLRDEGALYLQRRGIDRWPDHSVRGGVVGLCYIARARDGTPMAAQVVPVHGIKAGTIIRPDAGTKNTGYWPDGVTKRTYVAASGWHNYAAVHLPGSGGIILCEGVETGLSIWLATGRHVACCIGQAGLKWLRCGKRITIARDGDAPCSQADKFLASAIAERTSKGATVKVASPPAGMDFNDVHLAHGLPAVAEIIRKAKHGEGCEF